MPSTSTLLRLHFQCGRPPPPIPINVKRLTIFHELSAQIALISSLSLSLWGGRRSFYFCVSATSSSSFSSSQREIPSPVHPLNAGAPSSKLSAEDQTTDPTPTGQDEGGGGGGGGGTDLQAADSQPQEMLTH